MPGGVDEGGLQTLILLAAALAGASVASCRGEPAYRCASCNVVLVSIDTLRADHVGAYGYDRPTTPHLDTLASSGVVFENAISQSSWTRPAHMSMFTGLHPHEHGFVGLSDRHRLEGSTPTLASELREHGYATVAFTGGVNVAATYGFDVGFDLFRSNGRNFRDNLEETRYWLDEQATEPFFLFWHGYDAHTPYKNDPVDRTALGLPATRKRQALGRTCRRKNSGQGIRTVIDEYDAAVHHADRYLGKLLSELRSRDLLERTIVIVLSDHGEEFLDHDACFHLNTLYREVLHVPLVVSAPGLQARRVPALVPGSVSIANTILDLVGVERRRLPGPSLVGAITGGAVDEHVVVSETRHSQESRAGRGHLRSLTLPHEKLIDWITLERREWFDLERDPGELEPRTSGQPLRRAVDRLARWIDEHPGRQKDAPSATSDSAERRKRDAEIERDLRSLGYLD